MSHTIYMKNKDGILIELMETPYDSEKIFQELIEQYPMILAGNQINPDNPRQWILISREMAIPITGNSDSYGYLDHLFIDQDGIPTFVEVKRSTNSEIRRQVVGQMLDYAANATVYWKIDSIRQIFDNSGQTLEGAFDISEEQIEDFWASVEANLKSGKIRLLFIADEIPESLLRIIEFLNNQMRNTEVLGLEIKQYLSEDREQIIVPHIVGNTLQAKEVKRNNKNRNWNKDSFLFEIEAIGGMEQRATAEQLVQEFLDLSEDCHITYGNGSTHSSVIAKYHDSTIMNIYPWQKGVYIQISFKYLKEPFNKVEYQKELTRKVELALHEAFPIGKTEKSLSISLAHLVDEEKYSEFLDVIKYLIDTMDI